MSGLDLDKCRRQIPLLRFSTGGTRMPSCLRLTGGQVSSEMKRFGTRSVIACVVCSRHCCGSAHMCQQCTVKSVSFKKKCFSQLANVQTNVWFSYKNTTRYQETMFYGRKEQKKQDIFNLFRRGSSYIGLPISVEFILGITRCGRGEFYGREKGCK